jgi:hypothetical protein
MGLRIIETTVALIITVLLLTACISLDDRQTTSNELKKHALKLLQEDLIESGPIELRGDTIYFNNIINDKIYRRALVIDSIADYDNGNSQLVIMRVFFTSKTTLQSNPDSTIFNATTYLGTGRGNEVTLALASISKQDSSKYKLDWFKADCGYYGQSFRLPSWSIHEFKNTEKDEPWGAFVLNCNTSHMYSGIHIISILDLGGPFHLQKTLRYEVDSDNLSSDLTGDVSSGLRDELPEEVFEELAKTLSSHVLSQFYSERFFHTDIAWSYENRRFVINESSNYKYWRRSYSTDGSPLNDETVIPLPIRRIEYVQDLIDTGTYQKVNTIVD